MCLLTFNVKIKIIHLLKIVVNSNLQLTVVSRIKTKNGDIAQIENIVTSKLNSDDIIIMDGKSASYLSHLQSWKLSDIKEKMCLPLTNINVFIFFNLFYYILDFVDLICWFPYLQKYQKVVIANMILNHTAPSSNDGANYKVKSVAGLFVLLNPVPRENNQSVDQFSFEFEHSPTLGPYSRDRSTRSRVRLNSIDYVVVDCKTLFSKSNRLKLVAFEIMSTKISKIFPPKYFYIFNRGIDTNQVVSQVID
ncbi:Uncharacterized protein FWK35_00011533 [Aphis craccivora]|uniref:Uncharacterized protein n=1 Tax=Aphis craccivora TaxID=307492 RepID=A0A6G0XSU7_APHCR|nr:Uncharacterized protein FWK35_00011533 [Aphis craccivora]